MKPPRRRDPLPDELEVPLVDEISEADLKRGLELVGRKKLTIPGVTGGVFEPAREPLLVQRAATLAASSQQIAEGINHLQAAVKPSQLASLISETCEDVLRRIGEAGGLPDKLAKFVGRARSMSEAYRRLMSGSARLKLPGLNQLLIKTETGTLSAELAAIRKQFGHTYLTPEQLHALNRLSATTRTALGKASDGQLRMISRAIDSSSNAASGIERLAVQLDAQTSERVLPSIVERLGGGGGRDRGHLGASAGHRTQAHRGSLPRLRRRPTGGERLPRDHRPVAQDPAGSGGSGPDGGRARCRRGEVDGASLTLQLSARRDGVISAFEHEVITALGARQYDLVADNLMFEFKFWRGFGGRPASQAATEFAKDVAFHAGESFNRLRWVIAKDALSSLPAVESMMRGVLTRRAVRAELAKLGISVTEAQSRLQAALKGPLFQIF